MTDALHHLPLAANLDETVKLVFTVIAVLIWAASHLFSGKGKAKPPVAVRPRPQAPPQPGAAPVAGGQQPTLEETLRREVEEFMRRAQGREPTTQQRPAAKAAAAPQQKRAKPQTKPARGGQPQTPPRRLTDAPGSQPSPLSIEMGRGALVGSTVGQHVAEHLAGARSIGAQAQKLGSDIAQADERLQEHLQEKFSHQLGALEQRTAEPTIKAKRSVVAQDLFALLSQPSGMRQLVLASEILRRPEDRWENRKGGAHGDVSNRG